jgi:hypothetical protein
MAEIDWIKVAHYLWDAGNEARDRVYKNLDGTSRIDFTIEVNVKAQMYQDLALAIFSGFPQEELEARGLYPFGGGSQDATDNAEGNGDPVSNSTQAEKRHD